MQHGIERGATEEIQVTGSPVNAHGFLEERDSAGVIDDTAQRSIEDSEVRVNRDVKSAQNAASEHNKHQATIEDAGKTTMGGCRISLSENFLQAEEILKGHIEETPEESVEPVYDPSDHNAIATATR